MHEDMARDAEAEELDAWKQFKELEPFKEKDKSKAVGNTRWMLTWKLVDGKMCAWREKGTRAQI